MNGNLDLQQLQAFAAVVATGSITGAAAALSRSQPGVTRQIQDLEGSLGFDLLARVGRGVVLTERGVRFHTEVERHLGALRSLRERAELIRRDDAPAMEVASISAFAAGLAAQAMARVSAGHAVPIHLRALGGEDVVRAVLDRVSDLGLGSLPLQSPGLVVHWQADAPCVALVRADDALARQPVIALHELAGRRLITTANPYRQQRHVDDALRAAGVSRQVPLDTNTSFGAMGAVRAGLGVALIEPLTPLGAPIEGLVVRPIDRDLPFSYGAFTAAGRGVPPSIRALIDALRDILLETVPGLRITPAVARDAA